MIKFKEMISSADQEKVAQLEEALKQPRWWTQKITQDKAIIPILFSLFEQNRIAPCQFFTFIMHMNVHDNDNKDKISDARKTYQILDENGSFTKEAKNILLPALSKKPSYFKKNTMYIFLSEWQVVLFKHLIQCLPVSEQIFYTSEFDELNALTSRDQNSLLNDITRKNQYSSLGDQLKKNHAVLVYDTGQDALKIHLSAGVQDAFGLTFYKNNLYPLQYSMGIISPQNMLEAISHGFRPATLAVQGMGYTFNVHGDPNASPWSLALHDYYHQIRMGMLGLDIIDCNMFLIMEIIRMTSIEMCKEIWELTDSDFFYSSISQEADFTARFCKNLFDISKANCSHYYTFFCFNQQYDKDQKVPDTIKNNPMHWSIRIPGIIFILSLLENPKKWEIFHVESQKLISPFKENFEIIKNIYSYIINDNPAIKILKIVLYLNLKAMKSFPSFSFYFLNALIDKNQKHLLKELKILKVSGREDNLPDDHVGNILALTYNNKNIIFHATAHMNGENVKLLESKLNSHPK